MPTRESNPDPNEYAASVVRDVIAKGENMPQADKPKKNPAAVALGKLGASKGGKARAAKLSAERRKEIARKAAEARWGKQQKPASQEDRGGLP
jgi:hypothetical protein